MRQLAHAAPDPRIAPPQCPPRALTSTGAGSTRYSPMPSSALCREMPSRISCHTSAPTLALAMLTQRPASSGSRIDSHSRHCAHCAPRPARTSPHALTCRHHPTMLPYANVRRARMRSPSSTAPIHKCSTSSTLGSAAPSSGRHHPCATTPVVTHTQYHPMLRITGSAPSCQVPATRHNTTPKPAKAAPHDYLDTLCARDAPSGTAHLDIRLLPP